MHPIQLLYRSWQCITRYFDYQRRGWQCWFALKVFYFCLIFSYICHAVKCKWAIPEYARDKMFDLVLILKYSDKTTHARFYP